MGAKIASFLATLLLSIPLAAIGLMAVFGIPQLVPANGNPSSARDTVIRGVQDAFQWGEKPANRPAGFDEEAPRFSSDEFSQSGQFPAQDPYAANVTSQDRLASNSNAGGRIPSRPGSPWGETLPNDRQVERVKNQQVPHHWSEIPSMSGGPGMNTATRSAALSEPVDSSATRSMAFTSESNPPVMAEQRTSQPTGPLLTWRQASFRLNELGVKNYHLERGATEGTFLFVCLFSPGDSPQVVHRFEAEAEDPLIAVNHALQQVDKWMQSRYASSNYPSRPGSMTDNPGPFSR